MNSKIYTLKLNLGVFIKLKNLYTKQTLTLLVDTGADICLVKKAFVSKDTPINNNIFTNLCGIGEGKTKTIGLTNLELQTENVVFTFQFHVVNNNFPIYCDGIIGSNFLSEFNCKIDFCKNNELLLIRPNNFQHLSIPIHHTYTPNTILIPERPQVVRKINFNTNNQLLVPTQEISPGVFVANTLVSGDNAYIQILNCNNENLSIDVSNIITENLNNYDIIKPKEHDNNLERKDRIINTLSKNFPNEFKNELTNLCSKYTDIFALEIFL